MDPGINKMKNKILSILNPEHIRAGKILGQKWKKRCIFFCNVEGNCMIEN